MKKLLKICLMAVLLFPVAASAQDSKSNSSNLVFSAGGWYGVDFELLRPVEMTHNGYMTYEASVGFQTDPSDECAYAQAFGFPMLSVGFSVPNMADFKFVDGSKFPAFYALYGSFERSIMRRKHFSWGYQMDFGLAYNPGRYDPIACPANNWLSSPVMAYFGVGPFAKVHFGKHWSVGANVMFRHFSNGRTGLPNEALNAMGAGIFARYSIAEYTPEKYAKAKKVKKEFKKGMQYMVTAGFGVHTCQAEWNKYAYENHLSGEPTAKNPTKEEAATLKAHPKFSLSFDAIYRYSLRYATGLGVDMFYSSNMKQLEAADRVLYGDEAVDNSPGYSPISLGIAVVQEVYFRNFAVHVAIGAYPYRHKGVNDAALNEKFDDRERGWHYEKAGFRYYFPKLGDTFLGFAIKSHSIKAEYLEFSAGVRF
jgi:hypothetical protein